MSGQIDLCPLNLHVVLTVCQHISCTATLDPMAPDEFLKFISCNCKGDCSNRRCSCKKNDVKCISACGNYKGITCKNCIDDGESGEDPDVDL